jgi:hypothetical protein
MVVLRQSEYVSEVVDLARAELKKRGIAVPTPEAYWRERPQEWLAQIGFCYDCWSQTTDESPGNTTTFNLIGTSLTGEEGKCSVCASTIRTKHFWLIVPLVPVGRYRVIRYGPTTYVGRKLKE